MAEGNGIAPSGREARHGFRSRFAHRGATLPDSGGTFLPSRMRASNPQPLVYETSALPVELIRHVKVGAHGWI